METRDVTGMTLEELKAASYDMLRKKLAAEQSLNKLQDEIIKREGQAEGNTEGK